MLSTDYTNQTEYKDWKNKVEKLSIRKVVKSFDLEISKANEIDKINGWQVVEKGGKNYVNDFKEQDLPSGEPFSFITKMLKKNNDSRNIFRFVEDNFKIPQLEKSGNKVKKGVNNFASTFLKCQKNLENNLEVAEEILKTKNIKMGKVKSEVGIYFKDLKNQKDASIAVAMRNERNIITGIQTKNKKINWIVLDSNIGYFYDKINYKKRLIICEGLTDYLSLKSLNFNVLGLYSATQDIENILAIIKNLKVIICLDFDKPGIKKSLDLKRLLKEQCEVCFIDTEKKVDINDLLAKENYKKAEYEKFFKSSKKYTLDELKKLVGDVKTEVESQEIKKEKLKTTKIGSILVNDKECYFYKKVGKKTKILSNFICKIKYTKKDEEGKLKRIISF